MKINFLVAEEFRPEAGGKQMVLGLYPDDMIVLEPRPNIDYSPNIPEGLDRLSFLITISDAPENKHRYKAQIIDPSGNPHGPEMSLGESEIEKGTSKTFIIESKPFIMSGKGLYHLNFYVDDELHSFPFGLILKSPERATAS